VNERHLLRAYQETDSARVARILLDLVERRGAGGISRASIAEEWALRYPRHRQHTDKRSIRARIAKRLSALSLLRAVTLVYQVIYVGSNIEALRMIAANLSVVESEQGVALPPRRWRGLPAVPAYLKDEQQKFVQRRYRAHESHEVAGTSEPATTLE
jgi:hypothetical protein